MPAEVAVDLLRLFEDAAIDVWLDGGWAVDAALGEQTRSHNDLDIIVQISDLPRLREVLGARGFGIKEGGTESNFVLADSNGLEVDVHAFVFDETGNGVYRMSNGEDWVFPAPGFAVVVRSWVSTFGAFRRKCKYFATRTVMCRRRRICGTWSCSKPVSALNCPRICGVKRDVVLLVLRCGGFHKVWAKTSRPNAVSAG